MFIVYSKETEVIITTPAEEEKTVEDWFFNGGRKKEDYDREEFNESAVLVRPNLQAK